MARYEYSARDSSGHLAKGRAEAASRGACVAEIKAKGLRPVSVREIKPARGRAKIKSEDVELFCQQMSSMIGAGVPMLKAMDSLQATAPSRELGAIYGAAREGMSAGQALSDCLAARPDVFDDYFLAMVRAGEASGSLEEAFQRLEAHLAFQREMKANGLKVVRYPAIVGCVMLAALGIINVFVIPAFAKAYASFGAKLPFFTQLLIGTSSFLVDYGAFVLAAAWLAWIGARRYGKTPQGAELYGGWALKLPLFGPLFHKAALARYCSALASAYSCGLPLSASIELVAPSCDNAWLSRRLGSMRGALERGSTLAKACHETGAFRPDALQMLAVGEESGRLDILLEKVSKLYRHQVERELEALPPKLEPIMLAFMACLLLVFALGVFLPMWDLASVAMKGLNK